jgi:hypothetical protein
VSASSYEVRVNYDPSVGQVLGVLRTDLSIPPAVPYVANTRIVNLACSAVVAGAACRAWPLREVVVQHEMVKGAVLASYDCRSPGEPYRLTAQPTSQGTCDVGMVESSTVSGIVDPQGTLPDGSPNCTEQLVSIISEASGEAPSSAIVHNSGGVVGGVRSSPAVCGGGAPGEDAVRIFHHSELEPKKRVYPKYPDAAKEGALGNSRCLATVCIDEEGIPYDVMVEACPSVFAQPTKEVMMLWRWYPPMDGENAVKAQTTIAVTYTVK